MRCADCGCRVRVKVAAAVQSAKYLTVKVVEYCPVHGKRGDVSPSYRATSDMRAKGN